MPSRTRPYLFYDVALSLCPQCLRKIEAKIIFQQGSVYMLKHCPEHGSQRVLLADDVDYYRRAREIFLKPPEMRCVTTRQCAGAVLMIAACAPTTSNTPASR